jgi:hypothetical protein
MERLLEPLVPRRSVPDLYSVQHRVHDHVSRDPGKLSKRRWNANAALTIDVYILGGRQQGVDEVHDLGVERVGICEWALDPLLEVPKSPSPDCSLVE